MKRIVLLSVAMALSANAGYVPLASPPLSIVADKGAAVELVPRGEDACDVFVTSDQPLSEVKLTWTCDFAGARVLGDHWERAYGDLAWRDVAEDRAMPWYFLCQSFFLSWRASLMDDAVRAVLRGAFAAASRPRPNGEPLDWEANPFPATWRFAEGTRTFDWTDRTARAE